MIVDDDNNMPSRGRSVGVVYAPDVTYLNPNATFVKDNQNKPSKKVDEMLLNKTVSLPSGSSAFGKHVPQFDFSSSRHQCKFYFIYDCFLFYIILPFLR